MLLPLLLALLLSTGCSTAFGKFWGERGRDLADVVKLEAGIGPGIGVSARAFGVAQQGLCAGSVPRSLGIGWDYGRPWGCIGEAPECWDGEVSVSLMGTALILASPALGAGGGGGGGGGSWENPEAGLTALFGYWQIDGSPSATLRFHAANRTGWGVFDGFLGFVRAPGDQAHAERFWIWSDGAVAANRRMHVHAFDAEASVYAGFVYAKAGVSVGEALDFALGFLGIDVALDDER